MVADQAIESLSEVRRWKRLIWTGVLLLNFIGPGCRIATDGCADVARHL